MKRELSINKTTLNSKICSPGEGGELISLGDKQRIPGYHIPLHFENEIAPFWVEVNYSHLSLWGRRCSAEAYIYFSKLENKGSRYFIEVLRILKFDTNPLSNLIKKE